MIDEETLKERENDFYNDNPRNFNIYGWINIIIGLLCFSLLVERITNDANILEILFVNVTLIVVSLFSGIALITSKRKEYKKGMKNFFLIMILLTFINIVCRIWFYVGVFDLIIYIVIDAFMLYSLFKGFSYKVDKEYALYFNHIKK